MQDLSISLVQIDQAWEDKTSNYLLYETELAKLPTSNLIVLPEMFQTGFSMNTKLAEPFSNSESIAWLKEKAKDFNSAIYTSLMVEEKGHFYNRGVFVYPNGDLIQYDKRKTFGLAKEDQFFTAGNKRVIVEYLGWKIQLQVCYDLRFPEIMRNGWNATDQIADYDVLLLTANWPAKRKLHWESLLKARAIENQCFVVAVNRIGEDGMKHSYDGGSVIIDAWGNYQVEMNETATIDTAIISLENLQETRSTLPFLKDCNR